MSDIIKKQIVVTMLICTLSLTMGTTCICIASDSFSWPLFIPATSGDSSTRVPALSCAGHKVTLCKWSDSEVGRKFLSDCTVKFYEFGQLYYTGTWKPITNTVISYTGKFSRKYDGEWINDYAYKEKLIGSDKWVTYNCCEGHKVTKCFWKNIELSRKFFSNCTVKFYEFGQSYSWGIWKPLTDTTVSYATATYTGKFSRKYEGVWVNRYRYKEKLIGADQWTDYYCK